MGVKRRHVEITTVGSEGFTETFRKAAQEFETLSNQNFFSLLRKLIEHLTTTTLKLIDWKLLFLKLTPLIVEKMLDRDLAYMSPEKRERVYAVNLEFLGMIMKYAAACFHPESFGSGEIKDEDEIVFTPELSWDAPGSQWDKDQKMSKISIFPPEIVVTLCEIVSKSAKSVRKLYFEHNCYENKLKQFPDPEHPEHRNALRYFTYYDGPLLALPEEDYGITAPHYVSIGNCFLTEEFVKYFKLVLAEDYNINFYAYFHFSHALAQWATYLTDEFYEEHLSSLLSATRAFLLSIPESDLKSVEKAHIDCVYANLRRVIENKAAESSFHLKYVEEIALEMSAVLLFLPQLEKRVAALKDILIPIRALNVRRRLACEARLNDSEFPEVGEDLETDDEMSPPMTYDERRLLERTRLDSSFIVNFVTERCLLERLLERDSHMQIVTRTIEIFEMYAFAGTLEAKHIRLIWQHTLDVHESVVASVYTALQQICGFLDAKLFSELLACIVTLNVKNYVTNTVELLFTFAPFALSVREDSSESESLESLESQHYGLKLLWNVFQSPLRCSAIVCELALQRFEECMARFAGDYRNVYMRYCVDNLMNHVSVVNSLRILTSILGTFNGEEQTEDISCAALIEKLQNENDLFRIFFSDFNSSLVSVQSTQCAEVAARLEFLRFVLENSVLTLSSSDIDQLWESILSKHCSEKTRDYCFQWLCNICVYNNGGVMAVSAETLKHLFVKKLCGAEGRLYTRSMFACFSLCLIIVNENEETIQRDQNAVLGNPDFALLQQNLVGAWKLWEIAIKSEDPGVRVDATNLILSIYQKPVAEDPNCMKDCFVEECLKQLQSFVNFGYDSYVSHGLEILEAYLRQVDKVVLQAKDRLSTSALKMPQFVKPRSLMPVSVMCSSESIELMLPEECTVLLLKVILAKKLNECYLKFKVLADREALDNDTQISTCFDSHFEVVYKAESKLKKIDEAYPGTLYPVNTAGYALVQNIGEYVVSQYANDPSQIALKSTTSSVCEMISQKEHFFEFLLKMLSYRDIAVCVRVWNIICSVPMNMLLLYRIQQLPEGVQRIDWEDILYEKTSMPKYLYCLMIADALIADGNWITQFGATDGFRYVFGALSCAAFQYYLEHKSSFEGFASRKALSILLKIYASVYYELYSCSDSGMLKIAPVLPCPGYTVDLSEVQSASCSVFDDDDTSAMVETLQNFCRIAYQMSFNGPGDSSVLTAIIEYSLTVLWIYIFKTTEWLMNGEDAGAFSIDNVRINLSALTLGLVFSPCAKIRRLAINFTQILIAKMEQPRSFRFPLSKLLLEEALGHVTDMKSRNSKIVRDYFQLFGILVESYAVEIPEFEDIFVDAVEKETLMQSWKGLYSELITLCLTNLPSEFARDEQSDEYFTGILTALTCLCKSVPEVKTSVLIETLFSLCHIRKVKFTDSHEIAKCMSRNTRAAVYALLHELTRESRELMTQLLTLMNEWYDSYTPPPIWTYFPDSVQRGAAGYCGLINPGCVCYVNSTLQQLFMHPKIRKGILETPLLAGEDGALEEKHHYFRELQIIFSQLLFSEKKASDPSDFCAAYKDFDGNPIDVTEQMDANEFLNMLIDKMEETLKEFSPGNKDLFMDTFGGSYSNQIICDECGYCSEVIEPFYTLGIVTKNKKYILEGLDDIVQGESLTGENAYLCTKCDKKQSAMKRTLLNKVPQSLIVNLKRFEFDFDHMQRLKLNDYMAFPPTLNVLEYTKVFADYMRKNEKETGEAAEIDEMQRERQNYQYELVGVVVHAGSAEVGHYYSYIRERGDSGERGDWLEFNDSDVTPFDFSKLSQECFGSTAADYVSRTNNAYLLFYERVCSELQRPVNVSASADCPSLSVVCRLPRFLKSPIKLSPLLSENIWNNNVQLARINSISDPQYFHFVHPLVYSLQMYTCTAYPKKGEVVDPHCTVVVSFATRVLLLNASHFHDKQKWHNLIGFLKIALTSNLPGCIWFLDYVVQCKEAKAILLRCHNEVCRVGLTELIITSMKCILPWERELYGKSESCVERFIVFAIGIFSEIEDFWRTFKQYFILLHQIACFGTPERRILMENNVITECVGLFLGISTPMTERNDEDPVSLLNFGSKREKVDCTELFNLLSFLVTSSHVEYSTVQHRSV